jgi:lysozyme family protein
MAYTKRYEKAFALLIDIEKEYANLRGDRGGRTMWGIAENFWPAEWEDGPPTIDRARVFYHREFWAPQHCDDFDSDRVAFEVFEASVNCGLRNGARFLQQAVNLIGNGLIPTLRVDGIVGPLTVKTVNVMCKRYEDAIVAAQNYYQADYFVRLDKPGFVRGWFAKRLELWRS